MDSTQQALANAYHDVLTALPQHWLDRSRSQDPVYAKLSGLFLPGTSTLYQSAPQKIMVIGRETRRWDVLKGNDEFQSLKDYIPKAMASQQDHLAKFMLNPKDRGASFFNFLRDLAGDHGTPSIAWANLFSFAWNKKSPMGWEHFPTLLEISEKLLKVQIEILKPDIVIFANGASSAKFRQRYFPHRGQGSVCSESGDFCENGIPRSQLWKFTLYQRIRCFRIQHPSSISAPSRAARRFLLEHLRGGGVGEGAGTFGSYALPNQTIEPTTASDRGLPTGADVEGEPCVPQPWFS